MVALPLAWVFAQCMNAEAIIWVAFPVAEGVALIVGLILMKQVKGLRLEWLSSPGGFMAGPDDRTAEA